MSNLKDVYQRGSANISAAYQSAISDYHMYQASGDVDGMAQAAITMAGLEATHQQFQNLAYRAANPQPSAAPTNKYGLTETEAEVARNFTSDDSLSADDRMKIYAEQKAKYQYARAVGSYRDDQGSVKR